MKFTLLSLGVFATALIARAAEVAPIRTSMQAESPVSDYTAAVFVQVMLIGVLVTFLLGAGFLVLNLGLLSKRREDRIGGRTPSDVGILKENVWPQEEPERRILPADEDQDRVSAEDQDEAMDEDEDHDHRRPAA